MGCCPGNSSPPDSPPHLPPRKKKNTKLSDDLAKAERERPEQLLNASRKKRIAAGSGTTVEEVNRLLKQFEQIKKLMKQFSDMGRGGGKKNRGGFGKMKLPF